MARKGWNSLSPGYRARIEKAGLTKADYEAGQSLQKARGHANTPERPSRSSPTKFPKYHAERQRLTRIIAAKKQQFFGISPKWNPVRATKLITEKSPPLKYLRWASQADEMDWLHAIREDPTAYSFLGYH